MALREKYQEKYNDVVCLTSALYDDATRPKKVQEILMTLGAEKMLGKIVCEAKAEKVVESFASLTTVAGLKECKAELSEMAAPIIAKARSNPKELMAETKELAAPYVEKLVIQPVQEKVKAGKDFAAPYVEKAEELAAPYVASGKEKIAKGKELAAPYIASVKESSAPYVAKIEELRRSEKVEAMLSKLQEVRERAPEKAGELRAKAVDLIKYENMQAYREHVMSPEFQADTMKLLKEDLPALASAKYASISAQVRAKAASLAEDIESHFVVHKAKVTGIVTKGTEYAKGIELEALAAKMKEIGAALTKELQSEVSSSIEAIKAKDFSVADAVARLKRIAAVIDELVLMPLKTEVKSIAAPTEEKAGPPEPAAPKATPPPADTSPDDTSPDDEEDDDDDDEMHDAE